MSHRPPDHEPTQAEIRRETERIKSNLSPEELERKRVGRKREWTVPEVRVSAEGER